MAHKKREGDQNVTHSEALRLSTKQKLKMKLFMLFRDIMENTDNEK